MRQRQNKPTRQCINEEGNQRLHDMPAREGIGIDITEIGIWVSHARRPDDEIDMQKLIADLGNDGIAVEAHSFYCG